MAVLPNLTPKQLKKIDTLVNQFIWKNHRAKIPKNVLELHKFKGGLKLCNFTMRQNAMHIQWVVKTELPEFSYVFLCLCPYMGNKIWDYNLHRDDICDIEQCKQHCFWKDILIEWSKVHFYQPQCMMEIHSQLTWYNSKIRMGNKILLFNKKLYNLGILKLQDILDNHGKIYEMSMLIKIYGQEVLTEWLWFKQVNHALLILWKNMLVEIQSSDIAQDTNSDHISLRRL